MAAWIYKMIARIVDTSREIASGIQGKRALDQEYENASAAIAAERALFGNIYGSNQSLVDAQGESARAIDEVQTEGVLKIWVLGFAFVVAVIVIISTFNKK